MFTGIIESVGEIVELTHHGSNIDFKIKSELSPQLKIDQSVSHNGICLTVTSVSGNIYSVTAINETLQKTNLKSLNPGSMVNLERCMPANGRFDGHIVQGHVDQTGMCTSVKEEEGSWIFEFEYAPEKGNITVEKGSICINGVSLTCFNVSEGKFSVAIIPYTFEHTTFHQLKTGTLVNLEFDIIGKYVQRIMLGR